MNAKPPLNTEDYEAIEAAVMETPRGRWFLAEFLRRHQSQETVRLMEAVARLERALERDAALLPRVRAILVSMAAELGHAADEPPAALPEIVAAMAEEAQHLAALLDTARNKDGDNKALLEKVMTRQNLLAERLRTLARGIRELDVLCGGAHPVAGAAPEVPADALQWFAAHDDLFADAEDMERDSGMAGDVEPAAISHRAEVLPPVSGSDDAREKENAASSDDGAVSPDENDTSSPAPVTVSAQGKADAKAPEGPQGGTDTDSARAEKPREGHLTVLISPRARQASGKKDAGSGRRGKAADDDAPSRHPRIIIRHKSSSEELAIPFLDPAAGDKA
jgi:hypothetical protein